MASNLNEKTAIGFIGSEFESPDVSLPPAVVQEAKKVFSYTLHSFGSQMGCAGFFIKQGSQTYFLTAFHCITGKIRTDWGEFLASAERSGGSLQDLQAWLGQKSWRLRVSQGISISNCSEYSLLMEDAFDPKNFEYCTSRSQRVDLQLRFVSGTALQLFILEGLQDRAMVLLPFYDLAIFELKQSDELPDLPLLRIADSIEPEEVQYAVGFPQSVPGLSRQSPTEFLYRKLSKDGLAITLGPGSPAASSVFLESEDARRILEVLGLSAQSWKEYSNVFLSFARPGMSGGPILNSKGEVIGLLTGTPQFTTGLDRASMITVGPNLKMLKWVLEKLR